jgi:hypothetical protein
MPGPGRRAEIVPRGTAGRGANVAQAGRSRRELLGTEPGRLECGDLVLARLAPPSRRLPKGWDALSPYRPEVQKVGDASVKFGRSPALRVLASVLPERFNVLVNPGGSGHRAGPGTERRTAQLAAAARR